MTINSYFSIFQASKTKREEMDRQMVKVAYMIASLKLIEPLTKEVINWNVYEQFLKIAAKLDENIICIIFFDSKSEIKALALNKKSPHFFDSNSNVLSDVELFNRLDKSNKSKQHIAIVEGNIANGLGIIKIYFSLKNMQKEIYDEQLRAIVLTISLILIGIILSIRFAKTITKSAETLAKGMKKLELGDLNQTLEIKSKDEIGFLTESFNLMLEGLKERDRIKNIFQRYVAKQVADKILSEKDSIVLEGEKREITVLVADIRNFTKLASNMDPIEVVKLLNEFFTLIIDVIFKNEGTVDKLMGDGIMVVFGAPLKSDDDTLRAVKTAVEMQNELNNYNQRRITEGKDEVAIGIGINTGEAVVGSIGSIKQRMEYTSIGNSVNLTFRVAENAKPKQILITKDTLAKVANNINVVELTPITVKGKTEQVAVYSIAGLK
ncbi:MAG: adenylate/guanylate cyclase domain-containing protein [Candidatus Firestonebacteria bacterium]